ncbi:MAG: hypothetical protein ACYC8T_07070 [Myxococcaceae bacterium]
MPRRPTPLIVLLPLALSLTGCGDARPCSSCPQLSGSYDMVYEEQSRSADCAVLPVAPAPSPLELIQFGSSVRAGDGGPALSGTVYDSWEFTLTGTLAVDGGASEDQVSARARFVPPARADGGSTVIRGSWSQTARREGPQAPRTCSVDLAFTGTRR